MEVSEIQLFNLSKEFLKDDKKAEIFVGLVKQTVAKKVEEQKDVLASKKDIADLRVELRDNKVDTIKWVVGMGLVQLAGMVGTVIALFKIIGKA